MPNAYQDVVVNKPWGYEYLIFETTEVALWLLHIEEGKGTFDSSKSDLPYSEIKAKWDDVNRRLRNER